MKRIAVLALMVVACRRPLEPGETRCTTTPIYGTDMSRTRCKTAPNEPVAAPAAAPQAAGFWCTTDASFGACYRVPGGCEKFRQIRIEQCGVGSDAKCMPPSACFRQQYAMCATTGCFVDPASCASAEKQYGRDGSACRAQQ